MNMPPRVVGRSSPPALPDIFQFIRDLKLNDKQKACIQEVLLAGVELDKYGLIVPKWNQEVKQRIAKDLPDICFRIADAVKQGKHVLYFPGSYDLGHAGHASYILQARESYLNANPGLTPSDLYIVVLIDDDSLIQAAKPPHLKSLPGDVPRPIEGQALFGFDCAGYNPRAVDMASLPFVDLVGTMPAPTNFGDLFRHRNFQQWLKRFEGEFKQISADTQTIEQVGTLLKHLVADNLMEICADFEKNKFNFHAPGEKPIWSLGGWQLLLHQFLASQLDLEHLATPYVRAVSEHDGYKAEVASAMKLCGIESHFIDDVHIMSTTGALEENGWLMLARSKLAGFKKYVFG